MTSTILTIEKFKEFGEIMFNILPEVVNIETNISLGLEQQAEFIFTNKYKEKIIIAMNKFGFKLNNNEVFKIQRQYETTNVDFNIENFVLRFFPLFAFCPNFESVHFFSSPIPVIILQGHDENYRHFNLHLSTNCSPTNITQINIKKYELQRMFNFIVKEF